MWFTSNTDINIMVLSIGMEGEKNRSNVPNITNWMEYNLHALN